MPNEAQARAADGDGNERQEIRQCCPAVSGNIDCQEDDQRVRTAGGRRRAPAGAAAGAAWGDMGQASAKSVPITTTTEAPNPMAHHLAVPPGYASSPGNRSTVAARGIAKSRHERRLACSGTLGGAGGRGLRLRFWLFECHLGHLPPCALRPGHPLVTRLSSVRPESLPRGLPKRGRQRQRAPCCSLAEALTRHTPSPGA